MYPLHAAGSTGFSLPYQWGKGGTAGNTATASANAGSGQGVSSSTSDQVSLSAAAQAMLASDGGNGSVNAAGSAQTLSPDFTQEQQLLTTLTDKSLEAMGIISPADEAGTQISFDSLSYSASSSVSASISQQSQAAGGVSATANDEQTSAQLSSEQDVTLVGEGEITTADGRQFDFQVELQLGQSQQVDASTDTTGSAGNAVPSTDDANTANAASVANTAAPALSPQTGFPDSLSQLLALLSPSSSAATSDATASSATGASGAVQGSQSDSQATPASGSAPTGVLNWDAILKQSKAVFDLLDSLAASNQTASNQAPAAAAT